MKPIDRTARTIGRCAAPAALGLLLLAFVLMGCNSSPPAQGQEGGSDGYSPATEAHEPEGPQRVMLSVGRLSCGSCANRIRSALSRFEGVIEVRVNLSNRTASVDYDPAVVDPQAIADEVTGLGYPAEIIGSGP